MGFELDIFLHSAPTAWWVPWAPVVGSLLVAVATYVGVVHSSNKNANAITNNENLRHENAIREEKIRAERAERVAAAKEVLADLNALEQAGWDTLSEIAVEREGTGPESMPTGWNSASAQARRSATVARMYFGDDIIRLAGQIIPLYKEVIDQALNSGTAVDILDARDDVRNKALQILSEVMGRIGAQLELDAPPAPLNASMPPSSTPGMTS